ncbi:MAG: hypothetical protein ACKOWF_05810 [Chloroflexota bacterium]
MGPALPAPSGASPAGDAAPALDMEMGPDPDLDAIGRRLGLSRSSLDRDLLRRYARLWAPFREEAFDLLEVGFGGAASLLGWLAWFPNARVVGLDVRRLHLPELEPFGGRCVVIHGDQDDPAALVPLVREFRFRIVIDDGSTAFPDQQTLLAALYPALEPGGFYCAESFWDSRQDPIDPRSLPIPGMQELMERVCRALSLGQRDQEPPIIDRIVRQTAAVTVMPRSIVLERAGAAR